MFFTEVLFIHHIRKVHNNCIYNSPLDVDDDVVCSEDSDNSNSDFEDVANDDNNKNIDRKIIPLNFDVSFWFNDFFYWVGLVASILTSLFFSIMLIKFYNAVYD